MAEIIPAKPAVAKPGPKPGKARKPQPTVTIPASQAKTIAKALDAYATHLAAIGDTAGAIRFANVAAGLTIAAQYGTTDGAK